MNTYYSKNKNHLLDYQKNYYQKNKEEMVKKQKEKYHMEYKNDIKYVIRARRTFEEWYGREKYKKKFCIFCKNAVISRNFYKIHIRTKKHRLNTYKLKNYIDFLHKECISYEPIKIIIKKKKNNKFFIKQTDKEKSLILDFEG